MTQTEDPRDPVHGVALLTGFAREVMRAWLQRQGEDPEGEEQDPWKGFRVPIEAIARQLRGENPDLFDGSAQEARGRLQEQLAGWMTEPPEVLYPLAELAALFRLTADDLGLLLMAAGPAFDPAIQELYAFAWNNIQKQCADVGFLCRALALGDPRRFEVLLERMAFDAPLRRHRLLLIEERRQGEDSLDANLVQRRARVADQVLDFLRRGSRGGLRVDEALASVCVRMRERVPIEALSLPESGRASLTQIARSRALPTLFEGPAGAGKERVAQALATMLGKGLLSADLGALLNEPPGVLDRRLAEIFRESRLGGDLVYLQGHDLPDMISGPTRLVLERALDRETFTLGIDRITGWAAALSVGWPIVPVPLPDGDSRLETWRAAFGGEKRAPDEETLALIARRYQMSVSQIQESAAEARRLAQVHRRSQIDLRDLDRACRAHFAHQLSDVAQLVPPVLFNNSHLILPDSEKVKFDETLLYAREHDAIYNEWGFAEKFPYGRGLSVLFYGPPGTGKTMGAMIIANTLGLDLYRIDLSRIVSRYVGETEKNLARVFDEAERGQAMLLFDEADSLFTKRTEVKSSVDRYANLEVAYLLQRMENFEGVTVLTTNVEQNLDDAFKRRIRYRIYFPMPDAPTRARLWKSLIPSGAPCRDDIPFKLLGRHYEISGGYIKQAILRAGFYARRDGQAIGMFHLVEGAKAECREIGMLISDALPKDLAKAIEAERERPMPIAPPEPPPVAQQDE